MEESHTAMGESIRTSCERCRRRKIKCDRKRPCSRCVKAGKECILQGTGEKQRPVSKNYVTALEGQVAALEGLIRRLVQASSAERDEILSQLPVPAEAPGSSITAERPESPPDANIVAARLRSGQLRRLHPDHNGAQFFGGTSLFQIHLSREAAFPSSSFASAMDNTGTNTNTAFPSGLESSGTGANTNSKPGQSANAAQSLIREQDTSTATTETEGFTPQSGHFQYAPHDEMTQRLMAAFFQEQYQFIMVVYREYFLRDYDVGSGKWYADVLLYAICALGALQHDDTLNYSEVFSGQAQALLYANLDSPDITLVQALVLLAYREIAVGRSSKGWLFCGMACRLAHEMGLHLDPSNWDGYTGSTRDREILRRVYWAVFIADKQLSLFFGRPPTMSPSESDVRNTIRLQYPSDWQGLLETYVRTTLPATEFEDAIALVGSFIYRAELCKVVHVMITDLFENRRNVADAAIVAAKSRQIHLSLTKWLASLPGTLHWNQWTVGKVPPSVLHLHMMFHTVMIILHRPPSNMFDKPGIAESEDVEICYESLQAIMRLMRSFSRFYRFRSLPLDFVHTLSTAAGVITMKRYLQKAAWTDSEVERSFALILEAMDEIQNTWPCVREVRNVLVQLQQTQPTMIPQDPLNAPDLMSGLQLDMSGMNDFFPAMTDDIETLITDEFLSAQLQLPDPVLAQFDFNQPPGHGSDVGHGTNMMGDHYEQQ